MRRRPIPNSATSIRHFLRVFGPFSPEVSASPETRSAGSRAHRGLQNLLRRTSPFSTSVRTRLLPRTSLSSTKRTQKTRTAQDRRCAAPKGVRQQSAPVRVGVFQTTAYGSASATQQRTRKTTETERVWGKGTVLGVQLRRVNRTYLKPLAQLLSHVNELNKLVNYETGTPTYLGTYSDDSCLLPQLWPIDQFYLGQPWSVPLRLG